MWGGMYKVFNVRRSEITLQGHTEGKPLHPGSPQKRKRRINKPGYISLTGVGLLGNYLQYGYQKTSTEPLGSQENSTHSTPPPPLPSPQRGVVHP